MVPDEEAVPPRLLSQHRKIGHPLDVCDAVKRREEEPVLHSIARSRPPGLICVTRLSLASIIVMRVSSGTRAEPNRSRALGHRGRLPRCRPSNRITPA